MPFQIIRNDITKVHADAIVNTANPKPVIGGGTDSGIYAAAGAEQLLDARKKIGEIQPGNAVETPAFQLDAKYIIHTVGPVWIDGMHGESDVLHNCYEQSLDLADKLGCTSIAFPLIATGVYGFPKNIALDIALTEIGKFLLTHEMRVILVVFDRKALELSKTLVRGITEYIDDHAVKHLRQVEYEDYTSSVRQRIAVERNLAAEHRRHLDSVTPEDAKDAPPPSSPIFSDIAGKSLDEVLNGSEDTFQQRLFRLIDASGMDDVTVYKKANIDRKVFSRIRCKQDYKPKKRTAVAFAIALHLDMETMIDLLSRAEIAFSPSNKFDLIISYFITNKIYNIFEINATLFKYGQPILGE